MDVTNLLDSRGQWQDWAVREWIDLVILQLEGMKFVVYTEGT